MKINIIGAGISGLALGYFCKKIAYGQISFAANNGQIMKNNLVIWSH